MEQTLVVDEKASAAASGEVLRFEDVSLHFDGTPALDHVSFAMSPGETRVVFGAAGTGKTMLARRIPTILPVMTRGATGIPGDTASLLAEAA